MGVVLLVNKSCRFCIWGIHNTDLTIHTSLDQVFLNILI